VGYQAAAMEKQQHTPLAETPARISHNRRVDRSSIISLRCTLAKGRSGGAVFAMPPRLSFTFSDPMVGAARVRNSSRSKSAASRTRSRPPGRGKTCNQDAAERSPRSPNCNTIAEDVPKFRVSRKSTRCGLNVAREIARCPTLGHG